MDRQKAVSPDTQARRQARAGFTLMEVAIAIGVVVIGVLALFAMISTGLDASAMAVHDTHAAMFADDVFNGLRAVSLEQARESSFTFDKWLDYWIKFRNGTTNLPVSASDTWWTVPNPGNPYLMVPMRIYGDGAAGHTYTQRYRNVQVHGGGLTNIVNHALRYRLEVALKEPDTVQWTNRADVTLFVWDGEYGTFNNSDALLFYSEFDNPGDL